jgi:hypothetical protein
VTFHPKSSVFFTGKRVERTIKLDGRCKNAAFSDNPGRLTGLQQTSVVAPAANPQRTECCKAQAPAENVWPVGSLAQRLLFLDRAL